MNSNVIIPGLELNYSKAKSIKSGDIVIVRNITDDKVDIAKVIKEDKRDHTGNILRLVVLNSNFIYNVPFEYTTDVYMGEKYKTILDKEIIVEFIADIEIAINDIRR